MLLYSLVTWVLCSIFVLSAVVSPSLPPDQLKHLEDDPEATHAVHFDISSIDSKGKVDPIGTLVIALFGIETPVTVLHFLRKATNPANGHQNSIFHRIVKDFVIQGGNLIREGTGYKPVEYTVFEDEGFTLKHNKVGRLSMANAGPNTNGCQFFFTMGESFPHLDGKHVVFGQLVLGFETLEVMNLVETLEDRPINDLIITGVKVSTLISPEPDASGRDESLVSAGYKYLMIMCVLAALVYGGLHYRRRKPWCISLLSKCGVKMSGFQM